MPDRHQYDIDTLPQGVHASNACPPLSLLRAWKDEVLPDELVQDVASHAGACAICRTLLTDLEQIPQVGISAAKRSQIRRRHRLIAPPMRAAGWRWYAVFFAATVLIVAGAMLVVREMQHRDAIHVTEPRVISPVVPEPSTSVQRATSDPTHPSRASH